MPLPETYLLCSPDVEDPIGRGMLSADLIKGLRRCNPKITVPLPEHYESMGWRYPNMGMGHTCIWLGQPPSEDMAGRKKWQGGTKITSFLLGMVPEFSQIGPKGEIIARGWRDIFKRCITSGAVTKRQIEKEFRVRLDYVGIGAGCLMCARRGLRSKANDRTRLCDECEQIRITPAQRRKIMDYMRKQSRFLGESQVGYTGKKEITLCQS